MDLAMSKMLQAKLHLYKAFEELFVGNKRLTVGQLDCAKEEIISSIHILINEIIEEEGKF